MNNALTLTPVRAGVARMISDVSSPPALAVPALAFGVLANRTPGTYRYALLYFCIAVLVPVLYVVWAVCSGRITDFHMANRRERVAPFVVSLICGLSAGLLLMGMGAPPAFVALVFAMFLQTLLLFLITLAWQVSVHTAVTASLVTFACQVVGPEAMPLAGFVPLVASARLYLGRHTLAQTVVGACVGSSCFALFFALRGIAW